MTMIRADGIGSLSFRGVARALGVKPPSLYWHFESKEELLIQLQLLSLRTAGASMLERADAWEAHQKTAKQRVLARLLGFIDGMMVMPADHREVLSVSGGSRQWLSDAGAAQLGPHLLTFLSAPRDTIAKATASGAIKDGDADARTVRLWLIVQGGLAVPKFHRSVPNMPHPAEQILPAARDLLRGWGASTRVLNAIERPD